MQTRCISSCLDIGCSYSVVGCYVPAVFLVLALLIQWDMLVVFVARRHLVRELVVCVADGGTGPVLLDVGWNMKPNLAVAVSYWGCLVMDVLGGGLSVLVLRYLLHGICHAPAEGWRYPDAVAPDGGSFSLWKAAGALSDGKFGVAVMSCYWAKGSLQWPYALPRTQGSGYAASICC
ncbi:hypothetical protein Nepgr_006752 [Nepenthes gracilis]|uniref:Uncharacterized protein n=1 Tax=Nepenthes gracilis TaxID=150966 RepID=A0AAD3S5L4_NEPGR|nr:hypothetical protein Nepgr_006752 [Nepenthes gracilis]